MRGRVLWSVVAVISGSIVLVPGLAPEVADAELDETEQARVLASAAALAEAAEAPPVEVAKPPTVLLPLKRYRISAIFEQPGPHTGGVHSGLDFAAKEGRKVHSISPGKVVAAKWLGNAGQSVVVRTADGKNVLYGHLSSIDTVKGAKVQAGDLLGRVGSTGNSTGPHLHLEVTKPNGRSIDPLRTLEMPLKRVKREGRR